MVSVSSDSITVCVIYAYLACEYSVSSSHVGLVTSLSLSKL